MSILDCEMDDLRCGNTARFLPSPLQGRGAGGEGAGPSRGLDAVHAHPAPSPLIPLPRRGEGDRSRRRGATLIEVLVAIFIMAIGLLALLTLFPIGALRMAQSIQDERTGAAAMNAR